MLCQYPTIYEHMKVISPSKAYPYVSIALRLLMNAVPVQVSSVQSQVPEAAGPPSMCSRFGSDRRMIATGLQENHFYIWRAG
jgi:hypothetical protein